MTQTLKQAMFLARADKSRALRGAAFALDGKPVGGWPETAQAMREIRNELPLRSERDYTLEQFITAAYTVDFSDRYRSLIGIEERAAELEAAKRAVPAPPAPVTIYSTTDDRSLMVSVDSEGMLILDYPGLTAAQEQAIVRALPEGWIAAAQRVRHAVLRVHSVEQAS